MVHRLGLATIAIRTSNECAFLRFCFVLPTPALALVLFSIVFFRLIHCFLPRFVPMDNDSSGSGNASLVVWKSSDHF